jgi:hypothetical protein
VIVSSRTIEAMSFDLPTWVVPYALWSGHRAPANWPANDALTNARQWLLHVHRTSVIHEAPHEPLPTSLSMPHEVAQAKALGWDFPDGCVPWAANAAAEQHLSADKSAWAFVTLCNWHVSNGQVTMGAPSHLQIDADTDAQLFEAMQDFFAQDGIALYLCKPGQWLAQSDVFANLPTASLDRVIGRNIDPWLVGGATPTGSATLLRRLQNEMQMLLYTHDVNANRGIAINSLWWHGAGALPSSSKTSLAEENPTNLPRSSLLQTFHEAQLQAVSDLRKASLQQDWQGWMQAWTLLDQTLFADLLKRFQQGETMQVVLCGEYERHVYETRPASAWSRVQAIVGWQDLWQSNALLQNIATRFGATALHERLVVPPRSEDM